MMIDTNLAEQLKRLCFEGKRNAEIAIILKMKRSSVDAYKRYIRKSGVWLPVNGKKGDARTRVRGTIHD